MKKNLLTPIISFVCAGTAHASDDHISIKFGGWSKHLTDLYANTKKTIGDFNESHNAIGMEYNVAQGDDSYLTVGLHLMDDSYNKRAFTVGAGWKKRYPQIAGTDFFVDFGVTGGLQSRSFVRYERDTYKYISTEMMVTPFIAPLVNVGYQNFYTNIMVYPHITKENDKLKIHKPVIFWQFGIDFKV